MHKFFVDKNNIHDNVVYIKGEDVKHIYKVLRLTEGEKVIINDCQGTDYICEIISISKAEVGLNIIEIVEATNESDIEITLFQGIPKAKKMDLIIQKTTELGVKRIYPVEMERVVGSLDKNEKNKIERWNRIALEACKQSKRSYIPQVKSSIDFNELIKIASNMDLVIVPYENEENLGIKRMLKDINNSEIKSVGIVIGPEGGFDFEEIEKIKGIGAHIVTLGPRILRTETAGMTTIALIMYELGDLGGTI